MLTPSDRVTAIGEIASRLGKEDWPLIDLTLSQFSLPTTDRWSDDKSAYVIEMVSGAKDETLADLCQHLGYDTTYERTAVEPDFWEPKHFRLFASHLAKERELATQLQTALRRFHVSTFVAHADIRPTLEWQQQIELALKTADALVALLTPGFHESPWTDQEVGFALGRGILSFSVRLGEEPYGFIAKLQAFQGHGKTPRQLAREIVDALLKHKQTKKRMAYAFLSRFEDSDSFAEAKANMTLLQDIDYLDDRMAARVKKAVAENGQIGGSFGVPGRAESLISKWTRRGEDGSGAVS